MHQNIRGKSNTQLEKQQTESSDINYLSDGTHAIALIGTVSALKQSKGLVSED